MISVKIGSGVPVVVDENGKAIPGGQVHRVTFPERKLDTSKGPVWVIDGPGRAVVSVDGELHTEVPLS